MAIPLSRIREASQRAAVRSKVASSIVEARASGFQTAFLCHSHKDNDLVDGIASMLQESGWRVYVDWMDTSMPDTPDNQTATKIKAKIKDCNYFLFLATQNSMASRWCPWEIGYADGVKSNEKILIIPTSNDYGIAQGNEYLGLYRKIDEAANGLGLGAWNPGERNGVLVGSL